MKKKLCTHERDENCLHTENYTLVANVRCGEYLNCVCWGPEPDTVYTGGKEGAVVKLADVSNI